MTSYIDNKQNIWFLGKDVAKILGYSDTAQAIRKHVDDEDKYKGGVETTGVCNNHFIQMNLVCTLSFYPQN